MNLDYSNNGDQLIGLEPSIFTLSDATSYREPSPQLPMADVVHDSARVDEQWSRPRDPKVMDWCENQGPWMDLRHRAVLKFLGEYANPETGEAWPSQDTIAAAFDTSRVTINKIFQELKHQGVFLEIRSGKAEGARHSHNIYVLAGVATGWLVTVAKDREKPAVLSPQARRMSNLRRQLADAVAIMQEHGIDTSRFIENGHNENSADRVNPSLLNTGELDELDALRAKGEAAISQLQDEVDDVEEAAVRRFIENGHNENSADRVNPSLLNTGELDELDALRAEGEAAIPQLRDEVNEAEEEAVHRFIENGHNENSADRVNTSLLNTGDMDHRDALDEEPLVNCDGCGYLRRCREGPDSLWRCYECRGREVG